MKSRLLYTLIFIFCMSAFASSKNECTHPLRDSSPCIGSGGSGSSGGSAKGSLSREVSGRVTKDISGAKSDIHPSDDEPEVGPEEFSTFQFMKFLYI